jgi:polysaccharide pyruvyl transferase WcaK-like protein
MQKADSIYIRDEGSLAELEQAGVDRTRVHRTQETVFGAGADSWTPPSQRQKVVGVSIYTGSLRDAATQEAYCLAMSGLVDHGTARGYRVLFLPMQLKGQKGDDRGIIQRIITMSKKSGQIEMLEADIPTREHLRRVQECQLFIGHKTHSIIFSLVTGTPVLAISYHQKTNDFMAHYQLSDHCVNEPEISAELLCRLFDNIEADLDRTGETQVRQAKIQHTSMAEDFKGMLSG